MKLWHMRLCVSLSPSISFTLELAKSHILEFASHKNVLEHREIDSLNKMFAKNDSDKERDTEKNHWRFR